MRWLKLRRVFVPLVTFNSRTCTTSIVRPSRSKVTPPFMCVMRLTVRPERRTLFVAWDYHRYANASLTVVTRRNWEVTAPWVTSQLYPITTVKLALAYLRRYGATTI